MDIGLSPLDTSISEHVVNISMPFYPTATGIFSPMVSGWAAGGRVGGKSLSGLYLRNRKV